MPMRKFIIRKDKNTEGKFVAEVMAGEGFLMHDVEEVCSRPRAHSRLTEEAQKYKTGSAVTSTQMWRWEAIVAAIREYEEHEFD